MKSLAIYLSPVAAVFIRTCWVFANSKISALLTKRAFDTALSDARNMRDQVFQNPMSTDKHKLETQQQVEKLEKLFIEAAVDDVKNVRARIKEI